MARKKPLRSEAERNRLAEENLPLVWWVAKRVHAKLPATIRCKIGADELGAAALVKFLRLLELWSSCKGSLASYLYRGLCREMVTEAYSQAGFTRLPVYVCPGGYGYGDEQADLARSYVRIGSRFHDEVAIPAPEESTRQNQVRDMPVGLFDFLSGVLTPVQLDVFQSWVGANLIADEGYAELCARRKRARRSSTMSLRSYRTELSTAKRKIRARFSAVELSRLMKGMGGRHVCG